MKLDLTHLDGYVKELQEVREDIERLSRKREFLRLQVKQARQTAAAVKRNQTLKDFIAAMPAGSVTITPTAGWAAASVRLTVLEAKNLMGVPAKLGLAHRESSALDKMNIGSPINHLYTSPGVHYYITENVR
jgi:hypothetical protein